MKIALFVPSLRGGGAERVMINLAKGLANRGLKVDLVLARAEGEYLSEKLDGVRVIDLNCSRVLTSLPSLVAYLRREHPDGLLSALDHANIIAIWAKKLSGVRTSLVVAVHTTPSQSFLGARCFRTRLFPLLIRTFYKWADAVVTVSAGVAEDLIKFIGFPKEKIHVIYNPVITPEIYKKSTAPLNHPWYMQGEPPVILGVGRLTPAKDFHALIKAFNIVRKEVPARLIILGEGEERSRLEAEIAELGLKGCVDLPGFVKNPYAYINKAAVFVLSSRWEGLPTVLIEALALDTPVVSTACPSGPAEILEQGRWGKLVAVGDIEGLAKAIIASMAQKRIDDHSERVQMLKRFKVDSVVETYRRVILRGGINA